MKVVAIDYLDYDGNWEREQLSPLGIEFIDYHPPRGQDPRLVERAGDAEVLVVASAEVRREALRQLPALRLIIRLGVGVDNVDVGAATEQGVIVANMPGFCTREVAEHAAALILACARRICGYREAIAEGRWSRDAAEDSLLLAGKTIGVVGCGRIGGELLRLVRSWKMRRLVYDPYVSDARVRRLGAIRTSFEELLAASDVVSIHAPLTEETRGMFNREAFHRLKDGAILVNTARGAIVDEAALMEALDSGKLACAGLDVFEKEPLPPDSPLFRHPRVIVTPHVAWHSKRSEMRQRSWVVEDVRRYAAGRRPQHVVNPEVFRRLRTTGARG
ncbi:MAG: C-terminal binding protein [candidate division KSB1 bacterium]|nr:C-terminal binding protein [candidate division KSB1 bacterium]